MMGPHIHPSSPPQDPTSFSTPPFVQGREQVLAIMARANTIARNADLPAVIEGLLGLMMEITLAEAANFFELDEATDELVITHVIGRHENQHLVGLRLNRRQWLPAIALTDTRVIVVGDLPSEPDWLRVVDPLKAGRKRNVINLPITSRERTLGIIQIYNYEQVELELLTVLGERLAAEMEHFQKVIQTKRSNQRLLSLLEILGELAGTLDRNRLLHLVTENASQLVGAERSTVFLVDPKTREMIFQVAYQSPDPTSAAGLAARAAQKTRQARRRNFQEGEFSFFNRSAITVPIRGDVQAEDIQHTLGGLMVINKQNAYFQDEDAQLMNILANQTSAFLQVAEMYAGAGELFLGVIKALATAIDAKDPSTQGHSQRVSEFSVLIAQELGMDESAVNDIRIGSLFHDIGKIGIPDGILLKNGRLTEEEYDFIKLHPRKGVTILSQVKLLEPMTPAILEHHERLDGSGYPARLTSQQISWMGRIVAVADVYDAMTSNRPYREGMSSREVLSYLRDKAGILFDADCVFALEQGLNRPGPASNLNTGRLSDEYRF